MNLRHGELMPLVMAALGAFLSIATVVLGRTLSDAILLSFSPAVNVANFFIWSSLALMIVSIIYFALIRAIGASKLNKGILLLFAALTVLFETIKTTDVWYIYAYSTFLITAPALGNIIVWNAIGDAFNARQGRRLFHIVCAASTCGGIITGALIPPMLNDLGFASLPTCYAGIFAAATIPVSILHKNRRSERTILTVANENKSTNSILNEVTSSFDDFIKSPLIRNLSIVFFLTALTTNIIDYSLKYYLQTHYDQNGIATFYGHFNAISNAFNLIVQLTLLSSFLTRFRTRTLFAITPLVLLIFTSPFIFVYSAVCIVLMRFMDVALRFVIQDAAREIALSPLPRLLRNRAKIIFKGVMNPLGGIFAGIMLNMLAPLVEPQFLPLLLIPVTLTSLFCVRNLNRYCANNLFMTLQTSASKEGLLQDIDSKEDDSEPSEFSQPELLHDADDNVRMATLDSLLILKMRDEDAVSNQTMRDHTNTQIERDVDLAQAALICRLYLQNDTSDEQNSTQTDNIKALCEIYENAIQRVFKGLMLINKLEIISTVYQSLTSSRSSTRAQALELLQLTISHTPYAKRILILCDDFELEDKCTRLISVSPMSIERAFQCLKNENSRHMEKICTKLAPYFSKSLP